MINNGEWEKLGLKLSKSAPDVLLKAWQIAKSKAEQNKLLLYMAAITVVMGSSTQNLAAKLKFKQGEVGPTSTQETSSSTSSSTLLACNPTATTDENSVSAIVRFYGMSTHLPHR